MPSFEVARDHAVKVAAIIMHGRPKLDEPFADAWRRALDYLHLHHTPAAWLPDRLRERILPSLPGDTEVEKLAFALGAGTPALLFFTNSHLTAEALGFALPTTYSGLRLGRDAVADFYRYPLLPRGRIDAGGYMSEHEEPAIDSSAAPLSLMAALPDVPTPDVVAYLELLDRPADTWLRHDRKLVRRLDRLIRERAEHLIVP